MGVEDTVRRMVGQWAGEAIGRVPGLTEPLWPYLGFTLIELLVVVSIIALLIGFFMPAGAQTCNTALCSAVQ